MESDKEFNPDQKVGILPWDATFKIEVSGFFHAQLQQLIVHYIEMHGLQETMFQILEELKTREPKNQVEYNLLTLLTLSHAIEKAAGEQGAVNETTLGEVMKTVQENDPES